MLSNSLKKRQIFLKYVTWCKPFPKYGCMFSCSCYKPYESLMSRKNLLMYSLLENSELLHPNREEHKEKQCECLSESLFQSISGHKHHPCDRSNSPSAPTALQIFRLQSLLFLWPLSVPSSPPFPFNSFPAGRL